MNNYRIVRMLNWPFVWRWAVRIAEKLPHEQAGHCPPCLAKARLAQNMHAESVTIRAQVVCRKCGLPKERWTKRSCPNKFPSRIVRIVRRSVPQQVFWD